MHAIIMGAGEGTRMWPISTMVNKHLLKLGGKPVIRIIVDRICEARIITQNEVTIVCNAKDLKDYQWEFRDTNVNIQKVEAAGTADEFYNALLETPAKNEDILLHYGDSITDLNYGLLIEVWIKHQPINALIPVTQNIKHDYSQVMFDSKTSQVTEIVEKPNLTAPAWTGVGIFNAGYFIRLYTKLTEGDTYFHKNIDFGFHLLPAMTKEGQLFAYQYDGQWFDVGNLRSYLKLYQEYQNKDLNL